MLAATFSPSSLCEKGSKQDVLNEKQIINRSVSADPQQQPTHQCLLRDFTPMKQPNIERSSFFSQMDKEARLVEQEPYRERSTDAPSTQPKTPPTELSRILRDLTPVRMNKQDDRTLTSVVSMVEPLDHFKDQAAVVNDDSVPPLETNVDLRPEFKVSKLELVEVEVDNKSVDSSFEDPATLDQENVFFMGDEVGELTLGYFDGGDYCDVVWSFDLFSDDDENKKDRKQKSDIRKSISKSITPKSRRFSPRGVDGERQGVIDWSLQQQLYRQQSFKPKGNKRGYTFESDGADLSRDGCWPGRQSPNCIVEACPSLFPLEGDMSEVYPDTPSQMKGFSFLDISDIANPLSGDREFKPATDRYEVKTSLPEPDSSWYNKFFGTRTNDTRYVNTVSAGDGNLRSMSRLSNVTFHRAPRRSVLLSSQQKFFRLEQVLTEEELMTFAGYKDYGNGLFEC
jgi:hypothetical protein